MIDSINEHRGYSQRSSLNNRLSDLKRCIGALRNQTLKIDLILVVNNGSTDGTQEWLTTQSDITTITQVNTGSAGGQYTAFKYAYEGEADWIWTMDDDVVPQSDALESLLDAANFVKEPSFLCSIVESGLERRDNNESAEGQPKETKGKLLFSMAEIFGSRIGRS
jgi:GT2 family glycosyltransferase